MRTRRFAWIVVVGAASLLASGMGRAACNAIPDPAQLASSGQTTAAIRATIPIGLPYRGALGRINQAVALPGVTEKIVLGPDPECKSPGIGDVDGKKGITRDDLLVALLFQPEGQAPLVRLFGSDKVCGNFQRALQDTRAGLVQIGACGDEDIELILPRSSRGDRSAPEYRIHVPYPTGALLRDIAIDGPATALAVPGNATGIATVFGAAARSCSDLVAEGTAAYVCVDRIYSDFVANARCGVGLNTLTTVPCSFQNTVTAIDFEEQCEKDTSNPNLPACIGNPTTLTFSVDECGGVHMPFNWTGIRETMPSVGITRIVAGTSAVGREKQTKDPRIFLPGREFVGSTNPNDPMGKVGSWRKPEVAVWYPNSEEVGLVGTTDKNQSILHIYPRLEVTQLCDSYIATDEACLAVEQMTSGGVDTCAKQDRSGANPVCKDAPEARFYACEGGDFEGMPCTRPMHCGVEGTCTGQPSCQKKGEVWEKKVGLQSAQTCWRDSDCSGKDQCGYRLFNFGKDRKSFGKVVLEAMVKGGAGKKARRGACKGKGGGTCDNAVFPKSCKDKSDACRGYVLEARGTKAP